MCHYPKKWNILFIDGYASIDFVALSAIAFLLRCVSLDNFSRGSPCITCKRYEWCLPPNYYYSDYEILSNTFYFLLADSRSISISFFICIIINQAVWRSILENLFPIQFCNHPAKRDAPLIYIIIIIFVSIDSVYCFDFLFILLPIAHFLFSISTNADEKMAFYLLRENEFIFNLIKIICA